MKFYIRAEIYALLAALSNGAIGPLNRFAFEGGASHHQVAFLKCFGAFIVLLVWCLLHPSQRHVLFGLARRARAFALLSLLGVFSLYFFETWAFAEASIPLVSFLTYAAGGVTLILSVLVLGERLTIYKVAAFVAILGGVGVIFVFNGQFSGSTLGMFFALMGGLGYALFIFFAKKLNVGSGLPHLVWLFGFGSIYLAIPLTQHGLTPLPTAAIWPIVALIVVPTIGGFWFTTRAVQSGDASSVQIIETSDPLFASSFALVLFNETLAMSGWVGAAMIMGGLLLALKRDLPKTVTTLPSST
jgi:drug/metabolite transporter, DME family